MGTSFLSPNWEVSHRNATESPYICPHNLINASTNTNTHTHLGRVELQVLSRQWNSCRGWGTGSHAVHQPITNTSHKTLSYIIFFKIYWTGRQFHKDESAGNDDILVQSCVLWDRLFLKKSSCCCEAEPFNVCHSLDSPNRDSCPKDFSGRLWSVYVSPVDNHRVTWLLLKPHTPATVTVTAAQCGGLTVILRRSYCSWKSVSLLTLTSLIN